MDRKWHFETRMENNVGFIRTTICTRSSMKTVVVAALNNKSRVTLLKMSTTGLLSNTQIGEQLLYWIPLLGKVKEVDKFLFFFFFKYFLTILSKARWCLFIEFKIIFWQICSHLSHLQNVVSFVRNLYVYMVLICSLPKISQEMSNLQPFERAYNWWTLNITEDALFNG